MHAWDESNALLKITILMGYPIDPPPLPCFNSICEVALYKIFTYNRGSCCFSQYSTSSYIFNNFLYQQNIVSVIEKILSGCFWHFQKLDKLLKEMAAQGKFLKVVAHSCTSLFNFHMSPTQWSHLASLPLISVLFVCWYVRLCNAQLTHDNVTMWHAHSWNVCGLLVAYCL